MTILAKIEGDITSMTNLGGTDFADPIVPGGRTLATEGKEGFGLALLVGDLTGSLVGEGGGESEGSTGGDSLEVLSL